MWDTAISFYFSFHRNLIIIITQFHQRPQPQRFWFHVRKLKHLLQGHVSCGTFNQGYSHLPRKKTNADFIFFHSFENTWEPKICAKMNMRVNILFVAIFFCAMANASPFIRFFQVQNDLPICSAMEPCFLAYVNNKPENFNEVRYLQSW